MHRKYLTERLPGVGGSIKREPEDFLVEEVPLYLPAGVGEHTYFGVEKVGLSTPEAIVRIARGLGVPEREIGSAGMKDAASRARQMFSVRLVPPERVLALDVPNVKILWTRRHGNKLRIGHLKGNRFSVRLRGVCEEAESRVAPILEVLTKRGVPNYFGPQRFGTRANSHIVGKHLLFGEYESACRRLLGFPDGMEGDPRVREARERYERGDLDGALKILPPRFSSERALLQRLLRTGMDFGKAVLGIPRRFKWLYLMAYQSDLFNRCLERRLGEIDRLFKGDIAFKHLNGAAFLVEDPAREQERADRFEISPSGPIFGHRLLLPEGVEGDLEEGVLKEEGLALEMMKKPFRDVDLKGGRRAYRVRPEKIKYEFKEGDLELSFFLPKGSYATTFLRELMKSDR